MSFLSLFLSVYSTLSSAFFLHSLRRSHKYKLDFMWCMCVCVRAVCCACFSHSLYVYPYITFYLPNLALLLLLVVGVAEYEKAVNCVIFTPMPHTIPNAINA